MAPRSIPGRRTAGLACALLLALAPRPALAAWPNSQLSPLVLAGTAAPEASLSSIPDGAGGFFCVWANVTAGFIQEYAQRYDANGNALWTPGGVVLTSTSLSRSAPLAASDGAGGLLVAWVEQLPPAALRVQRLNGAGVPQWTAGGVRVATQAGDVVTFGFAGDGAGGAWFAWEYAFSPTDHDAYAQHVSSAGVLMLGAGGAGIATNTSFQDQVTGAGDGAGGMWIVWRDNRTVAYDVYTQHLNAAGAAQLASGGADFETFVAGDIEGLTAIADGFGGVIAGFALKAYSDFDVESFHVYADGSAVTSVVSLYASLDQTGPVLAPDGNGGAFFAWNDTRNDIRGDIYGQHITAWGTAAPGWDPSGSPIATGADVYQNGPAITGDGQGGVIVGWQQGTSSQQVVMASRLRPDGTRPPGWLAGGMPVTTKLTSVSGLQLSATGTGGAFCVWNTNASTSNPDVVAQRIDAFGQIGSPEPHIVSVRDVPNDQGGQVRVTWNASPLDAGLAPAVNGYQLWRQVPAAAAQAALRSGAASLLAPGASPAGGARRFRVTGTAAATFYWEYAGGVAAQEFTGYSLTAATTSDSVAASNPRTTFMVEALGNYTAPGPVQATTWWDSAPDSGYSVDNLPPLAPTAFAAAWSSAGTALTWNANSEPDLAYYRLYRGGTIAFVPSPANRIAQPVQTWFEDAGAAPAYYRLTAVDVHGNESPSVLVQPSGTAGVPGGAPPELAFALTTPNPARGAVGMELDLPRAADVSADVYDTAGRHVFSLAHGPLAAGRWPLAWRGARDDGGASDAGIYYVRVQAADRTWTRRVALLR